jgi:pentatricopeptide repeat protein
MASHDVVSWNAVILGRVKCRHGQKALELFCQMKCKAVVLPDPATFVGVLNARASITMLKEGRWVHEETIESCLETDVFVGSSLITMYAKCGSIEDALTVFYRMPTHNVVSWNAMILGHVQCGQGQMASELFQKMQLEGKKADTTTIVGVLNAWASVVALEEGMRGS